MVSWISRSGGQMSLRYTGCALRILAQRLGRQIDLHLAGERVGDDERRRRQIVGADLRLNAALEVAVAAQHRCHDQILILDDLRHRLGQRPAVADARRAAVPDDVEAELGEVLEQARGLVVLGDDERTRREAGLDPRLGLEAALDGVSREQAGANHHARIRRVGAARDRGHDHGAVGESLETRRHRRGRGNGCGVAGAGTLPRLRVPSPSACAR